MLVREASSLVVVIALSALCAGTATADRIVLKGGDAIDHCWIVEETSQTYEVTVVRGADVGRMTIARSQVESVERGQETLEQAVAKAERVRAERAPRVEPTNVTTEARRERTPTAEPLVATGNPLPLLTTGEKANLAEAIELMGEAGAVEPAPGLRARGVEAAASFGPRAIPALSFALDGASSYRAEGAARALARIAPGHRSLPAYAVAVPKLLGLLVDNPDPWVRISAHRALEGISGRHMAFPLKELELHTDIRSLEPSPAERGAADQWRTWWDAAQSSAPTLPAAPAVPIAPPVR